MKSDNEFLRSLDELTPDEIAPPGPPEKRRRAGDAVSMILLIVFASVFVFCAVQMALYFVDLKKADEVYGNGLPQKLNDIINDTSGTRKVIWTREPSDGTTEPVTVPSGETTAEVTTGETAPGTTVTETVSETSEVTTEPVVIVHSEEFIELRDVLLELQENFPEVIGYISVPSLGINYPLVQRRSDPQNLFYLTHDYTGAELREGAIYADYRCYPDVVSNKNMLIYGHNMRSGKMFGKLPKFYNEQAAFNNGRILIMTPEALYTYELFSTYRTTADDNYCRFDFIDGKSFTDFCNYAQERSVYSRNFTFSENDVILTISTCTNLSYNGRYAFHAVLTQIES